MSWLFANIYSVVLHVMLFLARLAAFLKPTWRQSLEGRNLDSDVLAKIKQQRAAFDCSALFYVSSAGEYEQAKPLIKLLKRDMHAFVVIVCFSQSGYRFAKSQGESDVFIKAPWDFPRAWQRLFDVLQPTFTIVVRHELWPAFCSVAARYSKNLVLINAQVSKTVQRSVVARFWQRYLLSKFHFVYLVNKLDLDFFSECLNIPKQRLCVTGDTKYDRVFERMDERREKLVFLEHCLDRYWSKEGKRRLIIGSAWPDDISLVLKAFCLILQDRQWQVMIAPHEVDANMITSIQQQCTDHGLSSFLYSEIDQQVDGHQDLVMIVDTVGLLAELYGLADLAFVGGALHHRVHNVLEPSCRGVPVAFGPKYHTSQEAVSLVNQSLVTVCENDEQFLSWWIEKDSLEDTHDHVLLTGVQSLCGASELICQSFQRLNKGP